MRSFKSAALATVLVAGLAATAQAQNTLRIANMGEPDTLDPREGRRVSKPHWVLDLDFAPGPERFRHHIKQAALLDAQRSDFEDEFDSLQGGDLHGWNCDRFIVAKRVFHRNPS